MLKATEQLDRRFSQLKRLGIAARPSRGWIRAIREALGMTTGQLAKRLKVQQPRVIELEKGEASGKITVQSLERAAEALGCRLVYVLIPHKPLNETIEQRALQAAERQLASVEQTMRLEAQGVTDKSVRSKTKRRLAENLLRRPARLWDET
jgi:predicted DNA-binding mobile mystery protein A